MATRKEQKKIKREKILIAAAQVFNRKGFNGTVMADIAAEAQIGKGTLYEYFNSKDDLFFAVFEWFCEMMTQRARVSLTTLGSKASDRLIEVGKAFLIDWVETREMFSLVMEFWAASASGSPQLRQRFKEYFNKAYEGFRVLISGLIEEGINRGEFNSDVDPRAVASVLVGTWDALFLQAWFDESFDPSEALEGFIPVLLRGLSAINSAGRLQE